jgi:quinol monooxygenase YgiN
MLIRIVRMTFLPEKVTLFLKNFEENKQKIRSFHGCRHLELWQDENQENIFTTYSHWENEEALNQYRDSELFKSVWGVTKPLFKEKPMAFSSKKVEEVIKNTCIEKNL